MSKEDRKVVKLTDNKFLNVFEVYDPDNHVRGYQFTERRGKDSVAFICYDTRKKQFILNCEFTPPVGCFHKRAFGGSLDKPELEPWQIVKAEVEEEAGYRVGKDDIQYVGKCFVSTQMNQECFLYLVLVDDSIKTDRKPENKVEAMAQLRWMSTHDILSGDDWKSIAILMKAVDKRILKVVSEDITFSL